MQSHTISSELKIDRSFIQGIPKDDDDAAIVRAVIALAESMRIDVIAEGVEYKEQLHFLLNEGCSKVQGCLCTRPMPIEQLAGFLNSVKAENA